MYCDHCGHTLAADSRFCSMCGKAVIGNASAQPQTAAGSQPPSSTYGAYTEDRVARHLHRLATFWAVSGVLRLMLVLWIYGVGKMLIPPFWEHARFPMSPFFQLFSWGPMLGMLAFFGLLHFVLAWGLYERQSWARFLGLILGFLALIRFPFGTALGIYTIWVLLPESSAREYDRLTHAHAT